MNKNQINNKIKSSETIELFKRMYVNEELLDYQTNRYSKLINKFYDYFLLDDLEDYDIGIFSAPGRTEISGNHTDHQNGKVLAASVNMDSISIARIRDDRMVIVKSEGYPEISFDLSNLEVDPACYETSQSLVKGICSRFLELGYLVNGFEAYVTSDVLEGSGISSSASFEVLISNIISGLFENNVSTTEIAQISQYSENVYFNKPCGLMDQLACSTGGLIYVDFKDKLTPMIDKVDFDFSDTGYKLCLVDTKGSHGDLTDDYASVPNEMGSIAQEYGYEVLRDLDEVKFYEDIPMLRSKYGDRSVIRSIHFFNENRRIKQQISALENKDFKLFLQKVNESGDSSFKYLQNIYSTKTPNIQELSLALALSEKCLQGKGASRVHGGGFAGTIQLYIPYSNVEEITSVFDSIYGTGSCHFLEIREVGGVQVI